MKNKAKEENEKLKKGIFKLKAEKNEIINKYNVLNYEYSNMLNLIQKNNIKIPIR